MWKNLVAALCLVIAVNSDEFDDFDKQMKDTFDAAQKQFDDKFAAHKRFGDLRESMNPTFQENPWHVKPFMFKPSQEFLDFRRSSTDSNKLGDISQDIHARLEPVRAMGLTSQMKGGVGGTTIVKHRPSGKQFLMRDYQTFTCSVSINENNGDCSGTLNSFQITESSPRSDWCFLRNYHVINNLACLSNGDVSLKINNGRASCISKPNFPPISFDEYKRLCSSVSDSAEYRYIPDENNPDHVAIPNGNRHVKCANNQRNYCIFYEKSGPFDRNGKFNKVRGDIYADAATQNKPSEALKNKINVPTSTATTVQQSSRSAQVGFNDLLSEHDGTGDNILENSQERMEQKGAGIGQFDKFRGQILGAASNQNKPLEDIVDSIKTQVQHNPAQVELNNMLSTHDVIGEKIFENVHKRLETGGARIGQQFHKSDFSSGMSFTVEPTTTGSVAAYIYICATCVVLLVLGLSVFFAVKFLKRAPAGSNHF